MTTSGYTSSEGSPHDGSESVANAGLVLLSPFFCMLFNMCGYLTEKKFKDEASRHRAIYLLQYLATGQELDASEAELALNKLICGIPVHTPAGDRMVLLEAEKELCHQLLRTVIAQWSILAQTSTEGLRESFLMRKGVLRLNPDLMALTVEPRPYDLLIDKIPWAFSVMKLDWMPKPLHTRWR